MRALLSVVGLACSAAVAFCADVRDLGVPAGWKASDYDNRGYDLLNKGDYDNARRYLDAAIRIEPDRWSAYYNRAFVSIKEKKWAAALQDMNSTIRLKPGFLEATWMRAGVNASLGNYKASLSDLSRLAELRWKLRDRLGIALALNARAWIYATCPDASVRNAELALADAKKACELSKWKHAAYIDTLAAASAEAGDFDSAIRYQQQAVVVNQSESQRIAEELTVGASSKMSKKLADVMANATKGRPKKFAERLQLYKQHRPYHEEPPR